MTREEWLAKKGLLSSSSMTPATTAPVEQTPAVAGSSSSEQPAGPNTTDTVKSSSMQPVTQEKPKKEDLKKRRIPAGKPKDNKTTTGAKTPVTDNVIPWTTPYTPPSLENTPDTSDYPRMEPYEEQANQGVQDERPKIRTLFQTLTGKDAIPYGEKWRWYLQHGFTGMHGGLHDELMRQVELEGRGAGQGSATYGQELRAKEQHRRSILDQWNRLLNEWNTGRYASGDKYTVEEFFNEAKRLRQEFANAGYNPAELRNPAINAGGFQQGFQKDLQNDRAKLDWLGGWLNDIQQNIAKDPNWLNSTQAQMYFDKLSEYTILNWAQSKGAIADAEKVRAQVEAMPAADRAVYDKFMGMFFNSNHLAQLISLADAGNHDAMTSLEQFAKFAQLAEGGPGAYGKIDKDGNYVPSKAAEHYGNAAMQAWKNIIKDKKLNVPIDVNSAVTSFKNAREAFQEYTMQNANVDRQMVWDSAVAQYNIYKDMYNRKLPELGLIWGWKHKGPTVDQNLGEYLRQWQTRDPTSAVMQNARLGTRSMPKPVNDPYGKKGGRGGTYWRQ